MKIRLFVYGTLMRGFGLNNYLQNFKCLGRYALSGFQMWSNGFYPMIKRHDALSIVGELYECDLEVWEKMKRCLDDIEGAYNREVVKINGEDAFIYVWKYSTKHLDLIKNGDFREYKRNKNERFINYLFL